MWFKADHPALWRECLIPDGTTFKTKNVILLEMIVKLWNSGNFHAKYLGVDSSFGRDHHYFDSLPQALVYFADIPNNFLVFTSYPEMSVPEHTVKGGRPSIPVPSFPPVHVSTIAADDSGPWNKDALASRGPSS
jgi:hypothetical protein